MGRYDEAKECFSKAIQKMDPDDPFIGPYLNSGDTMIRMGCMKEAIYWYESGISVFDGEDRNSFYNRLFWLYRRSGQFEEAKEILRKQYKEKLVSNEKYIEYMLTIDEVIHTQPSKSYVQRGQELVKRYNTVDAWSKLADIYLYETDNVEKAIEAELKAFEIAKSNDRICEEANVLISLMKFYRIKGDIDTARKYAEIYKDSIVKKYAYNSERDAVTQYFEDVTSAAENLDEMGECLISIGETEEAVKCLENMKKLGMCRNCLKSGCTEMFFLEGLICEEKGMLEDALSYYRKTLEINKDYLEGRYRVQKLEKEIANQNKRAEKALGRSLFTLWKKERNDK